MPLETSGTLSIGGTTTNRSINLELGRSATATSSLGETELRDLAGVASGAISISNFYGASSSYEVENSLKVQANSGNEWFYRSGPTAGNKKTFTFSFWIKRTQLTGYQADPYLMSQGTNARFHFAGDTLRFMFDGNSTEMEAAGKLKDVSAWYHIVLAVDTTQATNTNRVKMYVNGEDYPFNNNDYPSLNQESSWMSGSSMYFNTRDGDGSYDNSGYWAEVAVIDGSALTPTSFGEYDDSGIWKPKDLSGLSFGNQGFYLKFDNAASLGADSSGNGKNVTLNNITSADQATDTPTNNFSTLNPLWNYYNEVSRFTVSEGGTKAVGNQTQTLWRGIPSTMVASSGKWYFEVENGQSNQYIMVGVGSADGNEWRELTTISPSSTQAKMMYSYNGGIYGYNSSTDAWQYGGGFMALGDIQSFAVDLDNGYMYSRKNGGSWIGSGNPASGSSGTGGIAIPWYQTNQTVFILTVASSTLTNALVNFGGYTVATPASAASDANGYGTFEYSPPSGYYALCTQNLAEYG